MIPNLSKDMIDLMQQLRKRLRSEFDTDLKLSQPDVIAVILELVERSRDQKTQLLFADLEDMMGIELRPIPAEPVKPDAVTDSKSRVYRGQIMDVPQGQSVPEKAARSTASTRIYRGQVVA